MAGPAFVFIHLHADRCQQSNKFRVYGHKRQSFTCKYVCWAMGRGLKETLGSLRTQPYDSRVCVTPHPPIWSEGGKQATGLNVLHQKEKPGALSPQKDGGGGNVV